MPRCEHGLRSTECYTCASPKHGAKDTEKGNMTSEKLHLAASDYANRRKQAYIEAAKKGIADAMSEAALNHRWLAHYEGYQEGYYNATETKVKP